VFRLEKPGAHQSDQERVGSQVTPVIGICGRGMDFDQNFIVLGTGLFHLSKLKNVRRAEPCVNDGFHEYLSPAIRDYFSQLHAQRPAFSITFAKSEKITVDKRHIYTYIVNLQGK
jgi:hypothetical protein